jgi:endonuclease III
MALVEMYGKPTAVKLEAEGTLLERSGTRRTVLDSLVGTILSQNTTDVNSHRAFASLKAKFPQWADVLAADPAEVVEAIRSGGLAETKTTRIQNILSVRVTMFRRPYPAWWWGDGPYPRVLPGGRVSTAGPTVRSGVAMEQACTV